MRDNIERTILASILEGSFYGADERIINFNLDEKLFKNKIHKFIVRAIRRLHEQDKPIDSNVLYYELQKAYRKTKYIIVPPKIEQEILEIMATNAFTTYSAFVRYYKILEEEQEEELKKELARI